MDLHDTLNSDYANTITQFYDIFNRFLLVALATGVAVEFSRCKQSFLEIYGDCRIRLGIYAPIQENKIQKNVISYLCTPEKINTMLA